MKVAETIVEVRRLVETARGDGKTIGFVPTMGGLHEGHYSLIRAAGAECDYVVVSIFVNPTQFGPGEDLASYPRSLDRDVAGCRQRGAALVFAPSVDQMYGPGSLTQVTVSKLTETLCGRSRPGHFAGVCTVVAKLLNIVQPDKAFFGAKDYQQAVVVRRMVEDLNFPVEIVVCPTVREQDGLAMSSRNDYLTPDQRRQAAALYGALRLAEDRIRGSYPPAGEVIAAVREHLSANAPDGRIDYVQIVDPNDLTDVETTDGPVLVALAVRLGRARLIDNMLIDTSGGGDLE